MADGRNATDGMGDGMTDGLHILDHGGVAIAYRRTPGAAPGVVFLGGFRSDMTGTKATHLEAWARRRGRAFLRFDYRGHGASSGRFEDATIGDWLADSLAVLDQATDGPQVLVGSSMGGWLAVLAARARPDRVAGLVGIASAPDFTEALIWQRLDEAERRRITEEVVLIRPSAYDPEGYPITRTLIEEGRRHLVLDGPIPVDRPVRLLHGMADADVPYTLSLRLAERLTAADVRVTLVKDGDHRLSREADLALLDATLDDLPAG